MMGIIGGTGVYQIVEMGDLKGKKGFEHAFWRIPSNFHFHA
jgi:purine nucleoside phosphorylase